MQHTSGLFTLIGAASALLRRAIEAYASSVFHYRLFH
jgi:hypothetical protein